MRSSSTMSEFMGSHEVEFVSGVDFIHAQIACVRHSTHPGRKTMTKIIVSGRDLPVSHEALGLFHDLSVVAQLFTGTVSRQTDKFVVIGNQLYITPSSLRKTPGPRPWQSKSELLAPCFLEGPRIPR